MTRSQVKYR